MKSRSSCSREAARRETAVSESVRQLLVAAVARGWRTEDLHWGWRGVKISGEILNTPFFLFSGAVPSEIPGDNHIKVTESGGGEDNGGRSWLELPPGGLQVQPFTRWSDNFKAATSH